MKTYSKVISSILAVVLLVTSLVVSVGAVSKPKSYTVNLNANSSKGYSWSCTVNNKSVVAYSVKKKNVSKSVCRYTFTFTGKKKGSATAKFKYGTKSKTIKKQTVKLSVDDKLNVVNYISPKILTVKINTKAMYKYLYSYHCTDKSIASVKTYLQFKDDGATYIFKFKGLKKGTVTYTIKYQSSDQKSSTKTVKLNVDSKLNVTLAK